AKGFRTRAIAAPRSRGFSGGVPPSWRISSMTTEILRIGNSGMGFLIEMSCRTAPSTACGGFPPPYTGEDRGCGGLLSREAGETAHAKRGGGAKIFQGADTT